jgi:hypothetical protein
MVARKNTKKTTKKSKTTEVSSATIRYAQLPAAWTIGQQALRLLWTYKNSFSLLALTYALLTFVFVREFSGGIDVQGLRSDFNSVFGTDKSLNTSAAIFATLLTSGSSSSTLGSAYQWIFLVTVSLATIWALRMSKAGENWDVKDAFYKGMYPLVPFVLVILLVTLELLPFFLGATAYSIASGSVAISFVEKLPWLIVFIALSIVSAYLLITSLVAVYAVTLPDMTPLQALRSAKQLVDGRRLQVLRKMLFLPFALLLILGLIVLPVILILPVIAQWLFFGLSMVALIVVHAYMYELYRNLLLETEV